MTLSKATSGFDLEFMAGPEVVKHLLQLLMDTGDLDANQPPISGVPITLYANSVIRRTYDAFPGGEYFVQIDKTFALNTFEFGEFDPDYAYLSIGMTYLMNVTQQNMDLYLRIKKDIDLQAEFAAMLAFVDHTAPRYDILSLIRVETILASDHPFDPANPANNAAGPYQPMVDSINHGLTDFITGLATGDQDDVLAFIREQVDPFTLGALERLGVKCFPERNNLGLYLNLKLLDHKEGWLGPRGDLTAAQDFLPDGADFAIATAPDFAGHLVDDVLIKYVADFEKQQKILKPKEALEILDGNHYPLNIPKEMVTGKKHEKDDGQGALRYQIRDTTVHTKMHAFKDNEGNKTEAESLVVKLKASASLVKAFGLASDNIVLSATPLTGTTDGIRTADLGIDTDLRVDLLRTLVSLQNPLNLLKVAALPVVSVINLIVNGSDPFSGQASEMGFDMLARLPIHKLRWDPFYITEHGFLLEKKEFLFSENRSFLSGLVHLSKKAVPFDDVWVREALSTGPGGVIALLYHVDKIDEILTTTHFATDREDATYLPEDGEANIYRLEFSDTRIVGNAQGRIPADKLSMFIPYVPYSTRQDEHEGHHHIEAIRILNPTETDRIEKDLKDAWVEDQAQLLMDELEAAGVEFKRRNRDASREILEDFVRGSGGYAAEAEQGPPPNLEVKGVALDVVDQIEQGRLDAWVAAKVDPTIAALEEAGVGFDDQSRRKTKRILGDYVRSGVYNDFNQNQLPQDLTREIYAPGTLRLVLSPLQLHQLESAKILDLFGYAKVVRQGHLYFRDIADKTTKDNLLSLPEYS